MALTKSQVQKYYELNEQVKKLSKELEQQKNTIMASLRKQNSSFAHIETSFRDIADSDKLREHGLFNEFSKTIEVNKIKVDIKN